MTASVRSSILIVVVSLVLTGCDATTTQATAPIARDGADRRDESAPSHPDGGAPGHWFYGGIEDEVDYASVASLTSSPRVMLTFERKKSARVGALLQWRNEDARCVPEATVSIIIDGYETAHRAVRGASPDACSLQLSDGHLLWLAMAGATELRVEPAGSGRLAATFDVSGLDRNALNPEPVVR